MLYLLSKLSIRQHWEVRYLNTNVKTEKHKEKYACINIFLETVLITVVYVNEIELVWSLFLYNYIWMFYSTETWLTTYIKQHGDGHNINLPNQISNF